MQVLLASGGLGVGRRILTLGPRRPPASDPQPRTPRSQVQAPPRHKGSGQPTYPGRPGPSDPTCCVPCSWPGDLWLTFSAHFSPWRPFFPPSSRTSGSLGSGDLTPGVRVSVSQLRDLGRNLRLGSEARGNRPSWHMASPEVLAFSPAAPPRRNRKCPLRDISFRLGVGEGKKSLVRVSGPPGCQRPAATGGCRSGLPHPLTSKLRDPLRASGTPSEPPGPPPSLRDPLPGPLGPSRTPSDPPEPQKRQKTLFLGFWGIHFGAFAGKHRFLVLCTSGEHRFLVLCTYLLVFVCFWRSGDVQDKSFRLWDVQDKSFWHLGPPLVRFRPLSLRGCLLSLGTSLPSPSAWGLGGGSAEGSLPPRPLRTLSLGPRTPPGPSK